MLDRHRCNEWKARANDRTHLGDLELSELPEPALRTGHELISSDLAGPEIEVRRADHGFDASGWKAVDGSASCDVELFVTVDAESNARRLVLCVPELFPQKFCIDTRVGEVDGDDCQ